MKYNPDIHHRKSIRLKGYDYSQAGLYFITICCYKRFCRFGHIVGADNIPLPVGANCIRPWDSQCNKYKFNVEMLKC